ncbi:MAG: FtsQ-type POTRA domain-containing protein [Clostridia bacterium]|nr:FtsQ-type POTRA domain-containing protein [Clostridia bacterium]
MDENNDKFIIGDNTDGYRRSTVDYDLDLFAERKKPTEETKTETPTKKPARGQGKPQQTVKKAGSKTPSFFARKPSQPVPEKKGPTVKRHGKPPVLKDARKIRQETPAEERSLSENERRRLHAEQRRVQRRHKLMMQYIAIGVAVIGVMVALSLTVFFKIDKIEIIGKSPYTDKEIIAASGIDYNENIIMCDAKGVSEKLAKSLPHIGSATVKRSLNGKVTITVTVTPGRYSFINGDKAVVINAEGKVLGQVSAEEGKEFAVVHGVTAVKATPGELVELNDKGAFELLKSIGAQLNKAGIDKITEIDITDVYDISCVYDGRITILIGSMGSAERKLALAAEVIKRQNQDNPGVYGRIDLDSVEGKAFFKPLEKPTETVPSEDSSVPDADGSSAESKPAENATEKATEKTE